MRKNILSLFLTCCTTFTVLTVKAEDPVKNTISTQTKLLDERISELMADRVKKDILSEKLMLLEEAFLEEEEDMLFPADELYGSNWDTRWVDPFRNAENITFPDSCEIDCSAFILPLDCELKVTSPYGPRRRRMHRGIDLKVQVGDTIRAAFAGKVRIRNFERRGYGNYLVIRHPNGLETVYGHLSRFLVKVDDIVKAGDAIALGGNTGRSTGSHLHFETRFLGQALNPADMIDFENGVPHQDRYIFRNVKINGRNSNIYTSSENQLIYHRVKKGDTLNKVARLYGTTVSQLCKLNGLKTTATLRVGQALRCSVGGGTTSKTTVKEKEKETTAPIADNAEKKPAYHRIKSGDTLSAIAAKYGTTVSKLCELNGITKTTVLKLGRAIKCS
ncbi:MAG: peptidoglycan DD-metalloendopeptidase family protein [Tannerellaceae bacterium]|nr:peptidoglycan DD-metalloendopeptidase family protein [Tannerellaceae bacterium]